MDKGIHLQKDMATYPYKVLTYKDSQNRAFCAAIYEYHYTKNRKRIKFFNIFRFLTEAFSFPLDEG